ncbi:response regulator transcription factor [Alphaproteobacteria bacterium]|jgi:DNA-binding response OmpR family regulator|nr:response regulator transcription factor [Alphaproteobacteria bacterium]
MQVLSPSDGKEVVSSSRLLIVDDDAYLRATLRQQLAVEGFNDVFEVGVVADLDKVLSHANPDLILLDIQMPDGNGIDICQRLRRNGFAKPIVMLTAKGAEGDIVLGLEAGANDYITKPLRLGELIARIRTQLRQFRASDDARFEIGNLSFVPANKMLHEIGSERMQALTEKEATILKFLYWAFPNDVTKDELLAEVWGFQNGVSTHTLETHIYRLRQKISRLTKKQLVLTIEKGYRLAD